MSKSITATVAGVQLQVAADFSSTPEPITDPTGTACPLELSTGSVIVNGDLGIGITPPLYALHVGQNQTVRIEANANGNTNTDGVMLGLGAPGIFSVDAKGVPAGRFTVTNNGNVGINQPNPQYYLDVNGTMNVTSQISNPGMLSSSSSPDQGSLATVVVDTKTGILYFQN